VSLAPKAFIPIATLSEPVVLASSADSFNTAVGKSAGNKVTTGTNNTFIGSLAGNTTTTASNNTVVGYQAGYNNTTGERNTSVGTQSLYTNTTGSFNSAYGRASMYFNTTGQQNSAFGQDSLFSNTTGSYNVALGKSALESNTTGYDNTAVGYAALKGVTTGYSNTTIGKSAGSLITTGVSNTIVGRFDGNQNGLDLRTSSNNVVLSDGTGLPRAWIYSNAGWYQSNNSTSWSQVSDERIKENISSLGSSLSKILSLRPVEFDYKIKDRSHDIGFIAQEYVSIFPDQVTSSDRISGEISELTGGDPVLSIEQNLVPYLVKAIQELSTKNDALEVKNDELEARITALEA